MCDRALLGAYTLERRQVGRADVRRAWKETWLIDGSRWPRRIAIAATVTLVAMLALLVLPTGPWSLRQAPAATDGARADSGPALAAMPETIAAIADSVANDAPGPIAPTVPAQNPPSATTLGDVLAAQDARSVYSELAARWGLRGPVIDRTSLCSLALTAGLRCERHRGGWATLRALDLPAVLQLSLEDGREADLLVIGMDGDRIGAATTAGPVELEVADLSSVWHGDFVVLWHPHAGVTGTVWPGGTGAEVVWLRQALDRLALAPAAAPDTDYYDLELQASVRSFQRSVGLRADGIAGTETLIALTTRLDEGSRPGLGGG
jgi:general secretion pathway protein A